MTQGSVKPVQAAEQDESQSADVPQGADVEQAMLRSAGLAPPSSAPQLCPSANSHRDRNQPLTKGQLQPRSCPRDPSFRALGSHPGEPPLPGH